MKRLLVAALAAATTVGVAYAEENQSYQCQREGDSRTVSVEYSTEGGATSCSVMYKKLPNEAAKELWHYQAHYDQCQVQAQQFLKKLEGFGLTCTTPDKTAEMKQ